MIMNLVRTAASAALLGSAILASSPVVADNGHNAQRKTLPWLKHLVVIYMENHSFDNLYGTWEPVNSEAVRGLAQADTAHTLQLGQSGVPYSCLRQNDPNLTSPSPLATTCTDSTTGSSFASAFPNQPFNIEPFIPLESKTRDLVH